MANSKQVLAEWEKKFHCTVCDELPENPHILRCTHSFCKECIIELNKCPECGFYVTPKEVVPNLMLSKLLNLMTEVSKFANRNPTKTTVEEENEEKLQFLSKQKEKDQSLKGKVPKETSEKIHHGTDEKRPSYIDVKCLKNEEKLQFLSKQKEKDQSLRRKVKIETSKKIHHVTDEKRPSYVDIKRTENEEKLQSLSKQKEKNQSLGGKVKKETSEKIDHGADEKHPSLTRGSNKKHSKSETVTNTDTKSNIEPKTPIRQKKVAKGQKKKESPSSVCKTPRFSPKSFMLYSAKKAQCPNKVNTKGETRLQIACRQGKLSLVQRLLEEGAEPNVKDYAHWTPLVCINPHFVKYKCDAVNHGHTEVVRALLRAGACPNTPTQFNSTALVEAVVRRDKEIVRLLMSHGADMNQRTALDNTALSMADDEMKAVLLEIKDFPIQPHVQVSMVPKTILISQNQLPQENIESVMELCKIFNITLTTVFLPETTHVVVLGDPGGNVSGFEALIGLASGCCVVVPGWVSACLEAKRLIPVDGFEPGGTPDHPNTCAFTRARINREKLLPRLFDGLHVSLQHNQRWSPELQGQTEALAIAAGTRFHTREMDAERIPQDERTVMFHVADDSALRHVSHVILYRVSDKGQPILKYNMPHIKSLPVSWFMDCIKTFNIGFDSNQFFQS